MMTLAARVAARVVVAPLPAELSSRMTSSTTTWSVKTWLRPVMQKAPMTAMKQMMRVDLVGVDVVVADAVQGKPASLRFVAKKPRVMRSRMIPSPRRPLMTITKTMKR